MKSSGLTLGANGAYRNENTVNSQAYNGSDSRLHEQSGQRYKSFDQTNNKLLELTAQYKKNFGTNHNLQCWEDILTRTILMMDSWQVTRILLMVRIRLQVIIS